MIEKVILSIAEYFRVFQIICSIFIALAVSFTIERFFVVRRQWYWKLLLFGCSWLLSSMPFFNRGSGEPPSDGADICGGNPARM